MCWRLIGQSIGVVLVLSIANGAAAAETDAFPSLKPGLWEYQRVRAGNPQVDPPPRKSVRQCTDPTADMKRKWASLAAGDCRFSPIARVGNRYTYQSVCRRQEIEVLISSEVTVESDRAYRVKTVSHASGGISNEVVVARRVGDCTSAAQVTSHTP